MAHPGSVVAAGVVVAEVGTPALGAGSGRDHQRLGQVEQVAQLQGLGEVEVEHRAPVVDRRLLVAGPQLSERPGHGGQALLGAKDRGQLHHPGLELLADPGHLLPTPPVLEGLDAFPHAVGHVGGDLGCLGAGHEGGHGPTPPPAEHHDVEQGVGAQPVGPVHRHAGALAGGVEAGDDGALGVDDDLGLDVGRDASHGVVGGGLDGDEVDLGLEALVGAHEVGDVGQLGVDLLGRQVGQVEVEVVGIGAHAPALPHLGEHGPRDHVTGGQVLDRGGVARHEALTLGVAQDPALAPGGLGEQDAQLVDPGRVELEELHVLERDALPVQQAGAVPGEGVGVGGDLEHLAEAAGGEQQGLGGQDVEVTGGQLVGDDGGHPAVDQGHVEGHELVEEGDPALHALLVEGLEDHVTGAVGRVAGPAHRRLPVVAGVAAEAALVDAPVGGAVEGQAVVLELDHRVDGLGAHEARRRLVDQVVAPLDRVVGVPLGRVLLHVGQGRAHAPLRRAGVGAGGVQLGQHGHPAPPGHLDGCPQPGAAGAHDHGVVAVVVDLHRPSVPGLPCSVPPACAV